MRELCLHIAKCVNGHTFTVDKEIESFRSLPSGDVLQIIVTPYINRGSQVTSWDIIKEKTDRLRQYSIQAKLPITVKSGAIVTLNQEILHLLSEGTGAYCLADSKHVLCEVPEDANHKQVEDVLFALLVRGYTPMLAHTEEEIRKMKLPRYIRRRLLEGSMLSCSPAVFSKVVTGVSEEDVYIIPENNIIALRCAPDNIEEEISLGDEYVSAENTTIVPAAL